MAGMSLRLLALFLTLLVALWVPSPAHSRCPNRRSEAGNSSGVEGSGLGGSTVELSRRGELPPGCEENTGGMEEEEREFDSTVYIARLEFRRVETIFTILVFIMVVVLAKMVWHHRLMHIVASNIPESCMLIVVGAHIGGIVIGIARLDRCNVDPDPEFSFTPDLFFLFLLPPIVLEAGYFIDSGAFFGNLTTILVFAVIGTIWNAVALGVTLFVINNGGDSGGAILAGDTLDGAKFTISHAILFGTMCAAVDPVAVLSVFEDIHVNRLLHILVFGESLLNDAVTIVMFTVLGAFSNRPFDECLDPDSRAITALDAFLGVVQFFVVVFASLVIGVLTGMVASFITRFSAHVHVLEPMIVLVMGYLSYILADMFEFSGIVSLISCGIVMRHYIEVNLSRKSVTTTKYVLKVLSNLSENIIFLFLGITLYDTDVQNWDTGLSLWTVFFSLIYRPMGVIALTLIVNIFRSKRIGYKSVFVMSYSGLRGAVAFSLALARVNEERSLVTSTDPIIRTEFELRKTMLTAITFLVLFTVFVQGITIKPLVRLIKVRTAADKKPTLNEVIHSTAIDHMMSGVEGILGYFGHNRLSEKLLHIDQKYLRKVFERYPEAGDEKILHTFTRLQLKESKKAVEKSLFEGGGLDDLLSPKPEDEVAFNVGDPESAEFPLDHLEAEDTLPSLNDILAASFAHPHEDHFGHVLASHDREHPEDHHFEPVSYRKDIIRTKYATRKNRRRRRRQLHNLMRAASSVSIDDSRVDKTENQSIVDVDEVPDVPMPVSELPEDYDEYKEPDDMVPGIPLQPMRPRSGLDGDGQDFVPLSPNILVVESKQTEV